MEIYVTYEIAILFYIISSLYISVCLSIYLSVYVYIYICTPCGYGAVEYARLLTARVVYMATMQFGTTTNERTKFRRGCSNPPPPIPPRGTTDAEIECPSGVSQRFLFCKPVAGRNIALHAVPSYMVSMPTYLYSFCLPVSAHSTSFSLHVFNHQRWAAY